MTLPTGGAAEVDCMDTAALTPALSTATEATKSRAPEKAARSIVFIHSDAYFRVLSRLPVHPERERMTLALLQALSAEHYDPSNGHKGICPFGMQLIAPSLATDDQLMRFHARDYIDTIRRTATSDELHTLTKSNPSTKTHVTHQDCEEFELVDDAYVFPGLYEYCRFVAGASITAADALLHLIPQWRSAVVEKHEPALAPPVAINLGGGRHHAMRSQASGFCYVNDVVLAIQRLVSNPLRCTTNQKKLERVLCVDMDVHHGDGVQEAFYFSANATTVSFHLLERAFFPGTGTCTEIGVGRGKHHTINVPLRRGITDVQFTSLFARVVGKAVECVEPEVIVLVCGVDTLARDPLGGFNLTSGGISDCVSTVLGFNVPVLLLGGGGYSGADACRALAAAVVAIAAPELDLRELDVPEHDHYDQYGPDFRMATKPVIHRPNQNSDDSIAQVEAHAVATLENARQMRLKRDESRSDSKRKRC